MGEKADVIIPAHNEASTVAGVAAAARSSELVRRVIVVSDGSRDGTVEAARQAADVVVEVKPNRGKGAAMALGARYSEADALVFLDADLLNLNAEQVNLIAAPVLSGETEMNVGVVSRGPVYTWLSRFTPKISGQRAVRRRVLAEAHLDEVCDYGAEMALGAAARRLSVEIGVVFLEGVTFVKKYQKTGWLGACRDYARMFWQLFRSWVSGRFFSR
jgi:glycosyltransferase involved in cell wall biosynthesis